MLAACRVLAGVSVQSVAAVEDVVDLIQFRALVVVASRGSVSLGELAEATQIHLSRASRMCDRMVGMGLLNRADDPANRRQLIVTLTPEGRRIGEEVIGRRPAAIEPILARMPKQRRAELVSVLLEFAAAAGEPSDPDLRAIGWTTCLLSCPLSRRNQRKELIERRAP